MADNDMPLSNTAPREAKGGGKATAIDQSFIAQVVAGVSNRVRSIMPNTWFSPNQPLNPIAPQAEGRQWDYPVGYNLRLVPKEQEGITFPQLRQLGDGYDVLRLIIERRKDQMVNLKWSIRNMDPKKKSDEEDPRITQLTNFLRVPDGKMPWQMWLRMLLEDMIVCDNACVYPRMDDGPTKPPTKLELVCGDTIKPIIDGTGRTPTAPDVAYQQILKGVPAVDYSADQLIYVPRNRRTNKVYGYGYVEQILMTVNIALRRQISQLQYFTDGSIPNLLITAPKEWTPEQIAKFNKWFQEKMAGDTAARRQATFIPDGSKPFDTKDAVLKDEFDEWLVRVVCFAFSISPTPFVKQVNRATAESSQEAATQEGLFPIMQWIKDLMDLLIWKYWGFRDLEFGWDEEEEVDPEVQAKIDDINVRNGTKSIDEIRTKRGDEPIGMPQMIVTQGMGPVLVSTLVHQATTDPTGEKAAAQEAEAKAQEMSMKFGGGNEPGGGGKPAGGSGNDGSGGAGAGAGGGKPAGGKPAADAGKYLGATLKKATKKKVAKRINRDRQSVVQMRKELTQTLAAELKAMGKATAQMIRDKGFDPKNIALKLAKADPVDPTSDQAATVQEILDAVVMDGFDTLSDAAKELLQEIFMDGAVEAMQQLNLVADADSLDQLNEKALEYAEERGAELVGKQVLDDGTVIDNPDAEYSITQSTLEMLRYDIADAVENGISNEELAAALEESYAFSEDRAETIARTETAFADVGGNMAAYEEANVEKKQWIVGAGCCDECQALDQEIQPLDQPFSSGDDAPPAHPNCRCDVIPYFDDSGEQADQLDAETSEE
jgi:SPP1 gp7 family putative phage head morphogenesis protein